MALSLTALGHEVKLVYSLRNSEQLQLARYRQELPFETVPLIRYSVTLLRKTAILTHYATWADIVHFQKCFAWIALPAIAAAYRAQKPIHYDWDDWEYMIYADSQTTGPVGWFINRLERSLPKFVDTISVASRELGAQCRKLGFHEDRIVEAPVGADLQKYHPSIDGTAVRKKYGITGPLVMYMGQLSGAQYAELFLLAAKRLSELRDDVRFMVVGGGDRFNDLVKAAYELGIGSRMHFTNAVSRDLIPRYLAAADIAVACFRDNPQQRAKSPLKIAEYMAAGKAVVASAVGEVPRMLGSAGILVEPDNVAELVKGISSLLDDAAARQRLGAAARIRAESVYNWDVTVANLLTAYEKARSLYP